MIDLVAAARALIPPGKGILAADESIDSADKRLALYGIEGGEKMRQKYRDLFLGAPGIEQYLSGVTLFSETFDEKGSDKKLFPKSLAARGVAPGIKVDQGTEPFPESPDELITNGLIGLSGRLVPFVKKGAVFTKWRAILRIDGDRLPTAKCILENAKRLASYAKCAQEAGLVPILEPEVLLEGRHSRRRARDVIQEVMNTLFSVLAEHSVDRAGLILKTAMALSGSSSGKKDTPEEVAESTLEALVAAVPKQIAGVLFLSGGQTPDQTTDNLSAICRLSRAERGTKTPWPLSFSFARALQEEALAIWKGKDENVAAARAAFLARLAKVSAALAE